MLFMQGGMMSNTCCRFPEWEKLRMHVVDRITILHFKIENAKSDLRIIRLKQQLLEEKLLLAELCYSRFA